MPHCSLRCRLRGHAAYSHQRIACAHCASLPLSIQPLFINFLGFWSTPNRSQTEKGVFAVSLTILSSALRGRVSEYFFQSRSLPFCVAVHQRPPLPSRVLLGRRWLLSPFSMRSFPSPRWPSSRLLGNFARTVDSHVSVLPPQNTYMATSVRAPRLDPFPSPPGDWPLGNSASILTPILTPSIRLIWCDVATWPEVLCLQGVAEGRIFACMSTLPRAGS